MTQSQMIFRASLMAGLAFAAACSSGSDSTGPTATSVDLNVAIAQTTAGSLTSFSGSSSATGVPSFSVPSFDPTQCPYTATDQSFTCPSRSANGLTYSLKYYLYGNSGQPLTTFDPLGTSSVRTVLDASGALTGQSDTPIAISHHSDMILSGLLSATRSLSGTAHDRDTVTSHGGGITVKTSVDATTTTTNVVLPQSTTNPYPLSGTVAGDVVAASTGGGFSGSTTGHVVMTFNGTSIVSMTFSTAGGASQTCHVDLTGKTAPRC